MEEGWSQSLDRLAEEVARTAGESLFVISRAFKASRELLFRAWTEPEHMKNWWGPKGGVVLKAKMDFRPGGIYHYGMRLPDGTKSWGRFVYREIARPERLVWVNSFSDENGGITSHPMSPNWPRETLTTVTFTEQSGKTNVSIQWLPINATEVEIKTFEEGRQGMLLGWGGSLDQLKEYLAGIRP
ncbi:MAG: SRPBCC domain-containing protein [Nitrospinae bacterium]|nr:SRPBCC domain-containing protein [Nitrospinota bacterium]